MKNSLWSSLKMLWGITDKLCYKAFISTDVKEKWLTCVVVWSYWLWQSLSKASLLVFLSWITCTSTVIIMIIIMIIIVIIITWLKCCQWLCVIVSCKEAYFWCRKPYLRVALKEYKTLLQFVNPLTPMSDQDRISPNNINAISSRQEMRMKKNIN